MLHHCCCPLCDTLTFIYASSRNCCIATESHHTWYAFCSLRSQSFPHTVLNLHTHTHTMHTVKLTMCTIMLYMRTDQLYSICYLISCRKQSKFDSQCLGYGRADVYNTGHGIPSCCRRRL